MRLNHTLARTMLPLLVAAIALVLSIPQSTAYAQSPRVTLQDAIRQGIVDADFSGSGDPFWQESLTFSIKNVKPTPVTIVVPAGLVLEPVDDSYQRMVIAKEYVFALCGNAPSAPQANATPCASTAVKGKWYAFCIDLSRHAPDEDTEYRVGQMAAGPLLQVVQAVDRKSAAGRLGAQLAVWRVTDNLSLESLNTPELQSSELIRLIAPLLGLARPEIDLAQSLLEDSKTGLKFYTGTPPPDMFNPGTLLSPGTRTGIPEVDSLKNDLENTARGLAVATGIVGGVCVLSCVGLVALIALFALRKR